MAMPRTRRKRRSDPEENSATSKTGPKLLPLIALCLLMIGSGLLPYDRFAVGPSQEFASVPQMVDDPAVASASDVVRAYNLVDSARPYLHVDENRIYFDPHVAQGTR